MTLSKQSGRLPQMRTVHHPRESLLYAFVFQVFLTVTSIVLVAVNASAQQIEWIRQFGTEESESAADVATGPLGQVYVTGSTTGALAGQNFGDRDGFLIEYDTNGVALQTHQFGTSEYDVSVGATVDAAGNVIVGGTTSGSLGGPHFGDYDVFLMKHDDDFQPQGGRQLGTPETDEIYRHLVDTDSEGNIYILGNTRGHLPGMTAFGSFDLFIGKYDADGTMQWLQQLGSNAYDFGFSLASDGLGNVYAGGYTEGSFGGAHQGGRDAVLVKYDDSGNRQWIRQFGDSALDMIIDVDTDETGNVYVTGLHGSSANLDTFLAKYNAAGTPQWMRQIASANDEEVNAVTVNETLGTVVVAGRTWGDLYGQNQGSDDVFLTQYDLSGNLQWSLQLGTTASDYALGMATDNEGNIFVSGSTKGDFGGPSAGGNDAFIFKVSAIPEPSAIALLAIASLGLPALIKSTRVQRELRRRVPKKNTTMTPAKQISSVLLAVLAVLVFSVAPAQAKKPDNPGGGSEFQLIDLHPTGYYESVALAINDSGIAVGQVMQEIGGAGLEHAAGFWNATDTTPTFTGLAGGIGGARAINDAGQIVGWGVNGPSYWASTSAGPIDLPLPANFHSGIASGISDDGIVTGEIYQEVNEQTIGSAVAWRVTEESVFGPVVLAPEAAGNDVATLASGINRVVGRSADPLFGHVATAWDLSLLSDESFSVITSTTLVPDETGEAFAITDNGDLTGRVQSWNNAAHTNEHIPFVVRNDSLEFLSSGRRNYYGVGFDLNDTNVVGETGRYWYSQGSSTSATLWDSRNKHVDLSRQYFDDSWSYTLAHGINRDGEIVGYGSSGAWLLRLPAVAGETAVPEPSTLTLAFLCLAGVTSRRSPAPRPLST